MMWRWLPVGFLGLAGVLDGVMFRGEGKSLLAEGAISGASLRWTGESARPHTTFPYAVLPSKWASISSRVLPLVSGRKKAAVMKQRTVQAAKPKNMVEYPYLPTVGRKIAALPVAAA